MCGFVYWIKQKQTTKKKQQKIQIETNAQQHKTHPPMCQPAQCVIGAEQHFCICKRFGRLLLFFFVIVAFFITSLTVFFFNFNNCIQTECTTDGSWANSQIVSPNACNVSSTLNNGLTINSAPSFKSHLFNDQSTRNRAKTIIGKQSRKQYITFLII